MIRIKTQIGRQQASSFQLKRAFSIARSLNTRYGFIGLGRMGLPMAANLYRKGIAPNGTKNSLTVLDVSPNPYKELHDQLVADGSVKSGSEPFAVADSIEDLVNTSDFVITMLPEPKHVAGVYDRIVAALEKNPSEKEKIYVDCSTIDVETSLTVAKKLNALSSKSKITFVDAPVSGGTVGAANGTLTFMTGLPRVNASAEASSAVPVPSQTVVAEIQSVLAQMGARVVPCGAPGLGLAAKLSNNYILALNNVATAEGFRLANSLGLDLNLFSEIVNTSTGRSWSTEVNNPVPGVLATAPASRNYDNGFGIGLMRKDLGLALDAAKQVGQPLLIGSATYEAYQFVEREGGKEYQGKDMSVIYKYLEKKSS